MRRRWPSRIVLGALVAGLAAWGGAAGTTAPASPTAPGPATPARAAPTTAATSAPTTTQKTVTDRRRHATRALSRPPIQWDPIPFGPVRKAQMTAYTRRHYGSFMTPTWRLTRPHVIVIHYTESSYSSAFNTFASDVPDSELHELPATSAHYIIDTGGAIHQLVSLGTMARHTVGLNWTAIGIEHVGYSDAQVLGDHSQLNSSLRLVHWLRCRLHVTVANVIGHAESLSSPYHHEDVPALRTQTHGDFVHADMQIYRRRLRALGSC